MLDNKQAARFEWFKQNSKRVFVGAHDVFTPEPVIKQILDQIDLTNKPILALYNVEFLFSLVYNYNVLPSDITFFADHAYKAEVATKIGVNVVTNFDKITMKKRPVLLINPPYTDGTQGATEIYTAIITKCIDKFDPVAIGAVTPENLINGGQKKKTLRKKIMDQYSINSVKFLNQAKDWNNNISVDTIAWVAQEAYSGPTAVTGRYSGQTYSVDMTKHNLDELVNGETQDIHDWLIRVQTHEKLKLTMAKKTGNPGKQAKISKDGVDSLIVEDGYEYNSDNTTWRVAFGYMRCNTCAVVPPGVSVPSKYRYISFGTNQQLAQNFAKYMLSEPVRFILKMTYTSRTLDNPQLAYVPMIDLTRLTAVDDTTLYAHWNTNPATIAGIQQLIGAEVPF